MAGRPSGGGAGAGTTLAQALASPAPSVQGPLGDIGPPPVTPRFVEPEAPQIPAVTYPSFREAGAIPPLQDFFRHPYPSFYEAPVERRINRGFSFF